MSVINTNVNSLVSQAALKKNDRQLSAAMEQLSTGRRINSAKDDAAGLAVTSRMSAQISGLNQAVRNANDGISMLQTAEGATIEMSNMLQRMRELAVQSNNDTNTATDREYLDLEYQQLMKEIARIGSSAEWNGMKILSNTDVGVAGTANDVGTGARNVTFQVGANANQTINVGLKDFSFNVGVAATESKGTFNFSAAADMTDAKTFAFTITDSSTSPATTRTFTAALSTAVAGTAPTSTEVGNITTALRDVITNTVGYENVSVTYSGTVMTISDPNGRTLSAITMTDDAGDPVANTNVASIVAGTLASGAQDPANTAVFAGSARLNNTDIKTVSAANTAIGRLDSAIDAINKERATLGAVMNRLTYAADGLAKTSTNTSASRSRILDTDYAAATAELARTQIIQQAATAMLAQANQSSQTVLNLLK